MVKQLFYYSPGQDGSGNNDDDTPKTDNTRLATTDTVYVSTDGGTTNESFPVPGVEYDFCVDVSNLSELSSGAFYVRFTLDDGSDGAGNKTLDFKQDDGLDAGQSVKAVVHCGQFNSDDLNYTLLACIYAPSAPEKPINCAGTFGFNPHQNTNDTTTDDTATDDSGSDPADTEPPEEDEGI